MKSQIQALHGSMKGAQILSSRVIARTRNLRSLNVALLKDRSSGHRAIAVAPITKRCGIAVAKAATAIAETASEPPKTVFSKRFVDCTEFWDVKLR